MDTSLDPLVVRDFAIALLIGALIGIEREKRKADDPDIGTAGLRTFVLFAQAGAVSAWLARQQDSPWIFAAAALIVGAVTIAGYSAQARTRPDSLGLTTEMAAVSTFLLGGMALFGYPEIAVALAIVSSTLLAFKQPIHTLVGRLGTADLYAGLKLLVATFVVLPLLPDRPVDPWGALNPYELWWLVILISALSLVGYVAVRWLGPAIGTTLTGVFGGLVSSTAITLAFARRSREWAHGPGLYALAAGILLAWTIMFVRVIVEVAVVHAPLLPRLLVACGLMGGAALVAAGVFSWRVARGSSRGTQGSADVPLHNPFSLSSAIRFALLFALVLLVVALARQYGPAGSVYAVAALAGLTDVDAITLSMAAAARDGGDPGVAVAAILVAAITNTIVKTGLVLTLGAPALRRPVVAGSAGILGAGVLALALT